MIPNQPPNPADGELGPPDGPEAQSQRLVSRRALVRAGWTVPVILALHVPSNALAQYACTHGDIAAVAHGDIAAVAHGDIGTDPSDPDHQDVPAQAHVDVPAQAHVDTEICDGG